MSETIATRPETLVVCATGALEEMAGWRERERGTHQVFGQEPHDGTTLSHCFDLREGRASCRADMTIELMDKYYNFHSFRIIPKQAFDMAE